MSNNILNFLKRFSALHYGIFIVLLILCSVVIMNLQKSYSLKQNGEIVTVKITESLSPGKGGIYANYRCEFTYKKEVKNLVSQSRIRHNRSSYEGQYFPAMYSSTSDAIRLLMKPEDFEEFGISYPDSLLNRVIDISQ